MNFKEELQKRTQEIEKLINMYLPKEEGYQQQILEAMNYSILAGGKRLRPMLMLETFRLFNGTKQEIVEPFMAAIEMIHTYSLVHDDLPAIDNDKLRRGRATTHIVYGEAIGILTGDALLNYAFEIATRSFAFSDSIEKVAKAIQILAKKPGIYGMIGGQVVDVLASNQPIEKNKLVYIYQLKTGALIEASMMIGAVLANASEKEIELVEEIASDIGMAFQIQDDILDVIGKEEILGKPIHSDEKNKKTTYVTIEGMEKAKKDGELFLEGAMRKLEKLNQTNLFLNNLILQLAGRKK